MKRGDHVVHEHKSRTSYGIIKRFCTGCFGEQRAELQTVGGEQDPFPVCIEDLRPDIDGVVAGFLKTYQRNKETQ